MPRITLVDIPGYVLRPGQSVISRTPLTTPIPELGKGLQFWLTPESNVGNTNPYFMGLNAAGKYEASLLDQSGRLTWTKTDGVVHHDATAGYNAPSPIFMPTLVTGAAGVAGRAALNIDRTTTGLSVPAAFSVWTNYNAEMAKLMTNDFTLISYGSSKSTAVGGIFSTGDTEGAMDSADVGMRLGFPSAANGGKVIYQNTSAAVDRVQMDGPIVDDVPYLEGARGKYNAVTGKYEGTLFLATGGVLRKQDFSFTNPIKWDGLAAPIMTWGSQNTAATGAANTRRLQTGARWSYAFSDAELAYLVSWFQQHKGLA